ncbi:hypothetical protein H6G00_01910 [Leptolyngbya sp. FACHB-541]|uniref:hypothetical protein n=1 Tax=Leptolyngbya sp. FACHB-541 TaxID=2692810 RepID=UPI0016867F7C|nr:hypothetical protein [Leptolyngbya sp. FACHB-541]MBD1995387.1 hypothetical protein [Leptolyngbya sp. FACHB-541]
MKDGFEFRAVTPSEVSYIGNAAALDGGYVALSEAVQTLRLYESADDFNLRLALVPDHYSVGKKLDAQRIFKILEDQRMYFENLEKTNGNDIYRQWKNDIAEYIAIAQGNPLPIE